MPVEFDDQEKPYELFRKGKREGTWDPDDIDLEQDREDWESFSDGEQLQFLGISSGFYEGEEDVTRTLAPYMIALEHLDNGVAGFDTVQEEMYLSQQVYEEAKHTDFFSRYFETICGTHDTEKFLQDDDEDGYSIKDLYDKAELLREAAGNGDQTELVHTLAEAYLEYMGIVEAQAARGGYMVFDQIIELKAEEMGRDVVLPGFQEGIGLVRQDETRHIENGRWVLRKLAEADPAVVPEVYEPRMEAYVQSQLVSSGEDDDFSFEEVYDGFDQRKIGRKSRQFLQDTVDYIGAEKFDRLADVDRAVDRLREAPADD
jgi:ribonucleoside-diphosphate reductase beta chain